MKKKITVSSSRFVENRLLLSVDESIKGMSPAGQILVDSDLFSFVYLMEEQNEYTYIVLPENIWADLKGALDRSARVMIGFRDEQQELSNFTQELEYIISNIKGNSNYGNNMVTKVEDIF